MNFGEKTIESKYIYKGRVVNLRHDVVECSNGKISNREIIEHNGGAAIVAVNENDEIALVKQFRKPYEEVILEIPAGKLEKGEEPQNCAVRELQEEIGFIPENIKLITSMYPSPGYSAEKIYIFYCDKMKKGNINFDEDENIETLWVKKSDVLKMIKEGKIRDSKTIVGILMVINNMI